MSEETSAEGRINSPLKEALDELPKIMALMKNPKEDMEFVGTYCTEMSTFFAYYSMGFLFKDFSSSSEDPLFKGYAKKFLNSMIGMEEAWVALPPERKDLFAQRFGKEFTQSMKIFSVKLLLHMIASTHQTDPRIEDLLKETPNGRN